MRTNYFLSVLLAAMLMPPAAVAGPFVPPLAGPVLTARAAPAASCTDAGTLAARASFNRGMTFHVQGDYDQAAAEYGAAIGHDPGMAAAYDGRGHVLQAKSDMEGALASFNEASRQRLVEKIDWLAGRSPGAPVSRDSEGAIALVALWQTPVPPRRDEVLCM